MGADSSLEIFLNKDNIFGVLKEKPEHFQIS